jgi:hypothetical protein
MEDLPHGRELRDHLPPPALACAHRFPGTTVPVHHGASMSDWPIVSHPEKSGL